MSEYNFKLATCIMSMIKDLKSTHHHPTIDFSSFSVYRCLTNHLHNVLRRNIYQLSGPGNKSLKHITQYKRAFKMQIMSIITQFHTNSIL